MWFSVLNFLQSHLNFCTQGYGHVGCRSQVVAELQIGFQVCGLRFSIDRERRAEAHQQTQLPGGGVRPYRERRGEAHSPPPSRCVPRGVAGKWRKLSSHYRQATFLTCWAGGIARGDPFLYGIAASRTSRKIFSHYRHATFLTCCEVGSARRSLKPLERTEARSVVSAPPLPSTGGEGG